MRAAVAPVLACLLAAHAAPGSPPSLSGAWLFGEMRPEPREPVVAVPPRCWRGGVDFKLEDGGEKITGAVSWIPATGGVVPVSRHLETETLAGTRVGDRLTLTGEHRVVEVRLAPPPVPVPKGPSTTVATPVRYELRLDRRSGHLVGTRNGQPFWLARFRVLAGPCPPPPP
jgi:hypothetical protein